MLEIWDNIVGEYIVTGMYDDFVKRIEEIIPLSKEDWKGGLTTEKSLNALRASHPNIDHVIGDYQLLYPIWKHLQNKYQIQDFSDEITLDNCITLTHLWFLRIEPSET